MKLSSIMQRRFAAYIVFVPLLFMAGCVGPKIAGKVVGETYTSAQQDYSVPFPLSPSWGGRIRGDSTNDNDNGVTFMDDSGGRVSFYALQLSVLSGWSNSLQVESREKQLDSIVKKMYGGTSAIHFDPSIRGGTVSFLTLEKRPQRKNPAMVGVAAFIQRNQLYLVETDLSDATKFLNRNPADELEKWLEKRAIELVQTIQVTQKNN